MGSFECLQWVESGLTALVCGGARLGHKRAVEMFDPPLAAVELVYESIARVHVAHLVRLGIGERDGPSSDPGGHVAADPGCAGVNLRDRSRKEEMIEIVAHFRRSGSWFVAYGC